MNSRTTTRLLIALASVAAFLAAAAPVLAQEAGHGPVPAERRLLAVGILVAFLALMIVWAWLYRRVNRA
jgi:hypothetical protein